MKISELKSMNAEFFQVESELDTCELKVVAQNRAGALNFLCTEREV